MAVIVSLIVLHKSAIGRAENKTVSFSQSFRFTISDTIAAITKNDVTILKPLQASAIATRFPLIFMTLPSLITA